VRGEPLLEILGQPAPLKRNRRLTPIGSPLCAFKWA